MSGVVKDQQTDLSERVRDTVQFAVNGRITVRGDDLVVDIPDY